MHQEVAGILEDEEKLDEAVQHYKRAAALFKMEVSRKAHVPAGILNAQD